MQGGGVCTGEDPNGTVLNLPDDLGGTARTGNLVAQVHVERTIAASPERVFDWLLDPANLTVSPVFRKAGWAKDSSGPGVGPVREVTGIGFWVHEQITAYDAPRSYSYLAVRSFPASQHNGGRSRALRRTTARKSIG